MGWWSRGTVVQVQALIGVYRGGTGQKTGLGPVSGLRCLASAALSLGILDKLGLSVRSNIETIVLAIHLHGGDNEYRILFCVDDLVPVRKFLLVGIIGEIEAKG